VAAPLTSDELGRSDLHPRRYAVENLFRRLVPTDDPLKGMGRRARGLEAPDKALDRLRENEVGTDD